jgi:hypothetical protein
MSLSVQSAGSGATFAVPSGTDAVGDVTRKREGTQETAPPNACRDQASGRERPLPPVEVPYRRLGAGGCPVTQPNCSAASAASVRLRAPRARMTAPTCSSTAPSPRWRWSAKPLLDSPRRNVSTSFCRSVSLWSLPCADGVG